MDILGHKFLYDIFYILIISSRTRMNHLPLPPDLELIKIIVLTKGHVSLQVSYLRDRIR